MIPNRIVLDTNVCIDLFVFRDPRWERLLHALESRQIEAVTRKDCRSEWLFVLGYPHLPLNDASRMEAISRFDDLITCIEPLPIASSVELPVCKDKDDQKFLQLALQADASILITKDKALLKLAKRLARKGLFCVQTPEAWMHVQLAADSLL
ncbi:putative toxin-antitoxin system toxin component, PIN family [Oxalobacteraceae bacterium R-40]|uniref:Toxin-antitoxin system toxin component, PIN family n=1 Tax=Keguizhuia sedimenti TaxID=3064264 RepID=A0ABU1BRB4_9BURK|nr:putative toxin-antitoxin system toxin component, PIN family [Oxalobacteraceae bacterium R-40]